MTYDDSLAERIRRLLRNNDDVTERKMFGGLAFLINGHMAVVASGVGGLMVRVDPAKSEELVAAGSARYAEMQGKEMPGWLRIDDENIKNNRQLAQWVDVGTSYAAGLPPKR